MNKGLAIGLGVAGAAVVGGIGYVLLRRGAVTPAAAAALPPGPRLTATAPGGRTLAPPPPPGMKGVLSNYTRRDGGILYWNENEGVLYTQTGVPYVSSPTNLIVMLNYADGTPANQLVYLKGRVPYLPNGIRVMQLTPTSVNALQPMVTAPPSGDPSLAEKARQEAAKQAEAVRRAMEEAAAKKGEGLSASISSEVSSWFSSGDGRWSGRGSHQMSNRPTFGVYRRMRP